MGARNKVIVIVGLLLFLLMWSVSIVSVSRILKYPAEYAWFFGFIPLLILLFGLAKAWVEWEE